MARVSFIVITVTAVLATAPALAQFGTIFGDSPPRPPADIPEQSVPPQNRNFPDDGDNFPYRNGNRQDEPPLDTRVDAPVQPPRTNAPAGGAGTADIQSAPLPTLPGTATPQQVNPLPADAKQSAPQETGPIHTLPGLPPGIRQPRGTPQQPADAAVQPSDEIIETPPPQKIANPTAVFNGLDKITGRIISFDVAINETVQFGALQVTPRVCYSRPPTETAQTDAFVEVDEVTLQGQIKRIFTGWMFAASPGLHAVEHPIYDVWLQDCKGGKNPAVAEAPPDTVAKPQRARRTNPSERAPASGSRAQQRSLPSQR